MPGAYTGADGSRYAPQLSVLVFSRGLLKPVRTRVFLAELDAIKDDPLARAVDDPDRLRTLVAGRDPNDARTYRWDVRLQGAAETVFIDWLASDAGDPTPGRPAARP
jgi:protocatechuate 3,4-dioxygenase alpha subunit